VDVGAQVARDRINGLVFLFNADGEVRKHGYGPSGGQSLPPLVFAASKRALV
jgi:hypothetical protein